MLRLDLARLDREGSLSVEARIPPDDPMWDGTDLVFDGPIELDLSASEAGTGEIVVRGKMAGRLLRNCRRCLESVPDSLVQELTMVFAPEPEDGDEADGDARHFEPSAAELELSDAIREETLLAVDPYVVCDPECKGLCPRCGANRNDESCSCTFEETDSRWDALRSLKNE